MPHTRGLICGEALGVGREVADTAHRSGADRGRIEDGDVGERAGAKHATVREAEEIGGLLRQLVDCAFERQHLALAYPVAEEVGGQRGVAQLTDVRARIGQAERAAGLVEEHRDAVGVVVGEDRLHAERLDVTFVGAEVEQRVERIGAALLCNGRELLCRRARDARSTP